MRELKRSTPAKTPRRKPCYNKVGAGRAEECADAWKEQTGVCDWKATPATSKKLEQQAVLSIANRATVTQ